MYQKGKLDKLYDSQAALYVLSSIMKNPLLIQDDSLTLNPDDFFKPIHKMVFVAIYNLEQEGVTTIEPSSIDLYLSHYDAQYSYYKAQNGYNLVLECSRMSLSMDKKEFLYYYGRLKKFSLLRDLESSGIDTNTFYNTEVSSLDKDVEEDRLDRTALESIPNTIKGTLVSIEKKHIGKDTGTAQNAIQGLRELVQRYREVPEVGLPLEGSIINYALRGLRLGKLYTYSAPTGAGKTRFMLSASASISMPYIDKNGQVVLRGENGDEYQKVLFVTTEQSADEIQTMLLAFVSGVPENKILMGDYTFEELKRVNMALNIIERYQNNFMIEAIPDPSIAEIKILLTKYIIQEQIQYIFYDYIFSSPGLLSEFRDVAVREDVALMMLSNTLKEIAMVHNVHITSATQLNDGWSKKETGLRDQNCLRGSKAIADKIDGGIIGVRLTPVEFDKVREVWAMLKKKYGYTKDPNIVADIYKNRRGELNCVKVFRYFDYATCHCIDYFVTDGEYHLIEEVKEIVCTLKIVKYEDLGFQKGQEVV